MVPKERTMSLVDRTTSDGRRIFSRIIMMMSAFMYHLLEQGWNVFRYFGFALRSSSAACMCLE